MSTILDALRKVQRERDRESPDLRGAIAHGEPAGKSAFGPGHWMVVAGLALLAVGASAYLFLGGDRPGEAISPDAPSAAAEAEAESTPVASSSSRKVLTPAEKKKALVSSAKVRAAVRKRMASMRDKKSAKRKVAKVERAPAQTRWVTPPPRKATEPLPSSEPVPDDEPLRERDEPVVPEVQPTATAPPVREAAPAAPPEPAPAPVVVPEPEPVRRAAVPAPQPKPEKARPQVQRPAPRRSASDPVSQPEEPSRWVARFPDLRLQAVRWHPDSTRREAKLLVDATRVVEAREGDVIIGVAVHRIDPGAVELRVGDASRLLRIGQ